MSRAPSLADIEAIARAAFDALPEDFRRVAGEVTIHVEEFADEETLDALGIQDAFELTGLYHGVDRLHQSIADPTPYMPRVFLYRRPILDEWAERGDVTLAALVEHVLIHEIAHHFGLSDADIEAIEARD